MKKTIEYVGSVWEDPVQTRSRETYVSVTLQQMALSSALERLAAYRTNNTRASQDTFDAGAVVLKSGSAAKLGDDGAPLSTPITPPS